MFLGIMQEPRKPEPRIRAYFLPRRLNINKAYISSSAVSLGGGGLMLIAMGLPLLPGFTGVSLRVDVAGRLQTSALALRSWDR